jgi:hypothetical protein
MKISKKILVIMLSLIFTVFFTVQAFGMEMSAEEKEVWEKVTTAWEAFKKGDMDIDLTANMHKDLVYWNWGDLVPRDRERQAKGVWRHYRLGKVKSYDIEPIEIKIVGNVAILMYTYNYTNNMDRNYYNKAIHVYTKHDGKWVLLGGMSGDCKRPSRCP